MGERLERVDTYIDNAADFAKPILTHLRELIHDTCPGVEEAWKWSFPNFIYKGAVMCNMAAFKNHCSFGFWKASLMKDADNLFTLPEKAGMGHLGKIVSLADLPKDAVLKKYIKEAMKLNEDGVKVARSKPKESEKKELVVPEAFIAELKKNDVAEQAFNKFSYSHKKEYLEWFAEAKTEATRNKRMAQAIEWLLDGKSRNWKYQNC